MGSNNPPESDGPFGSPRHAGSATYPTDHNTDTIRSFAQQVYAYATDFAELSDGDYTAFIVHINEMERDWQNDFTDEEGQVASALVTSLSIGLDMFGSPRVGGQNAWKFIGSGLGVENPNHLYRSMNLQTLVESTALGIGAIVTRFGNNPAVVRDRLLAAGAYGLLVGVGSELRANPSR